LGISFIAANEKVTGKGLVPIKDIGATWVSLMPYGFVWKWFHNYNERGGDALLGWRHKTGRGGNTGSLS
jgi:hypothetical protein